MLGVIIGCRKCLTRARSTLSGSAAYPRSSLWLLSRHVCAYFTSERGCAQRLKTSSALRRAKHSSTMASADFCGPITAPRETASQRDIVHRPGYRSLRVRRVTFLPHIRRIYDSSLRMTLGFESFGPLAQRVTASYAIRVPRTGSLPAASFRFWVAPDTLAVRLGVPVIKASIGTCTRQATSWVAFAYQFKASVKTLRVMPDTPKKVLPISLGRTAWHETVARTAKSRPGTIWLASRK